MGSPWRVLAAHHEGPGGSQLVQRHGPNNVSDRMLPRSRLSPKEQGILSLRGPGGSPIAAAIDQPDG